MARFNGIVRPNGRVGTRNYSGVMATSGCSSSPAGFMAESIDTGMLADFDRVDGIVPITYGSGSGLADHGDGIEYLQRALVGWARHPNFAGILVVGLGCEINQLDNLMARITGNGQTSEHSG